MVTLQQWLRSQRINKLQAGSRTERHPDGHRPIQLHHRRRCDLRERIVECHNACPVCLRRGPGPRMTGGDCGLQRVRAKRAAELLSAFERGQTAADEELIPATAVLIDRKSTRLNSTHTVITYAAFCLKKKKNTQNYDTVT